MTKEFTMTGKATQTKKVTQTNRLSELLSIMARLRAADGCPWDREQTFASIAPYTIEEAYEVADAVERGDMPHLKDELGDLLFQVVFHAQIASEAGQFDFEAVAGAICDKLLRRHPHVFGASGPMTPAQQSVAWEEIKAAERGAAGGRRSAPGGGLSHLDGVPPALPALMRAFKLSKRAARVGFDFEHASQTADKVAEELAEVRDAAAQNAHANGSGASASASPEIFEEIGDLLFAAANLARKLDVDAEAALRSANAKFERRFRGMESLAAQRGESFADLNLAAQERLWQEVKRGE
jgi:nucleoside triphosphate diphosphatase